MVSHWKSNDESQVVMNWSSSGMGSTVKWCPIGSILMEAKWRRIGFSSGKGSTVKWCHIGSLMMKVKWRRIGFQLVLDRQLSVVTLAVL